MSLNFSSSSSTLFCFSLISLSATDGPKMKWLKNQNMQCAYNKNRSQDNDTLLRTPFNVLHAFEPQQDKTNRSTRFVPSEDSDQIE